MSSPLNPNCHLLCWLSLLSSGFLLSRTSFSATSPNREETIPSVAIGIFWGLSFFKTGVTVPTNFEPFWEAEGLVFEDFVCQGSEDGEGGVISAEVTFKCLDVILKRSAAFLFINPLLSNMLDALSGHFPHLMYMYSAQFLRHIVSRNIIFLLCLYSPLMVRLSICLASYSKY